MKNNVYKFPNQASKRKPVNAPAVIHEKPVDIITTPKANKIMVNIYGFAVVFNLVFWPLVYFFGGE